MLVESKLIWLNIWVYAKDQAARLFVSVNVYDLGIIVAELFKQKKKYISIYYLFLTQVSLMSADTREEEF